MKTDHTIPKPVDTKWAGKFFGWVQIFCLILVITVTQAFLWEWIKPFSWFLFWPAAIACIFLGSLVQGIIAAIIISAIVFYEFMPQYHSLILTHPFYLLSIVLFMLVNVFAAIAVHALRKKQRILESHLQLSSHFHEAVLNKLGEAILIIQEGKIIYANQKAEELLGYSLATLLQRDIESLIPPQAFLQWLDWSASISNAREGARRKTKMIFRHALRHDFQVECSIVASTINDQKVFILSIIETP